MYYAMSRDGVFFKSMGRLHPRSRVPVFAIILQGGIAIIITLSGTYEDILSYVVSNNFIFFGIAAASVFIYRWRERMKPQSETGKTAEDPTPGFRVPGHPYTTALFVAICLYVVGNTLYSYFINAMVGIGILLAGIPVYYLWKRAR